MKSLWEQAKKEGKELTPEDKEKLKSGLKTVKTLFDKFREQTEESSTIIEEFILKSWKFKKLSTKKKEHFKKILADTLAIAEERGYGIIKVGDHLDFQETESKVGIYRSKEREENIEKLKDCSSNNCEYELPYINLTLPKEEDMNINYNVESPKRQCIHVFFDIETNKHQHPIAMGVLNLEAKRFILWLKSPEESILTYRTNNPKEYFHIVKCENPLEAIFLADIENVYSQILLSALAQDQQDLISILEEIAIPNYPFDFEILKRFLFHEYLTVYGCHNAKFDVNMVNNLNEKFKKKGFSFLLPKIKPKTLKLFFGKNTTTQDSIARNFEKKLGNITAGFRYKISHDTKYHAFLGIPKFTLQPLQESSIPSSYAIDSLLLAMALQFKKPKEAKEVEGKYSLEAISYGTKYEKVTTLKKEKKIFTIKDFTINEEGTPSLPLQYLIGDVFANISGYGNLTQKLPLNKLYETLGIIRTHWFEKPIVSSLSSTASLAKLLLFALLERTTGLRQKQIETNIEKVRHYLQPFDFVENVYFENGKRKTEKIHTFTGARIQTSVFGKVEPIGEETIEFADFVSQYPHMSRLISAWIQYVEASEGILQKRIVQDKTIVENNIWKIVAQLIKEIDSGKITDKPFAKINGIVKIYSKTNLQLRQKFQNKKNDVLVKGTIITTISDLVGAILRKYYLEKIPLGQIRKHIRLNNGLFLNFEAEEIIEHGKEYFTQLYKLRKEFQFLQEFTIEQLLKIIMNASYGIASEGISKEDWTGKLFIPSIANGITATARLTNTIAEIETIRLGGTPLYTHTDSVISLATKNVHHEVNKLFEEIDPLKIETENPIKWIAFLGKAKYGYMDSKGNFTQKTHGAGAYGGKNVAKAYEMMYKLIYEEGLSVSKASQKAKYEFPLFYQLDIKNNYEFIEKDKRKQNGTVRNIKRIMNKGELIDSIDFNGATIYIYELIKQLKTKIKYTYLVTTTNEIMKGMFCQFASFNNVKFANFTPLESIEIAEFLITQDIPQEIKDQIAFELTNRTKAEEHLKRRFWFDESRFGLKLPDKAENKVKKRLSKYGKRAKIFYQSVATDVINVSSNQSYMQLQINKQKIVENLPDIPLIKDDRIFESDGFKISGFTKLPDLNFTEYLLGNMNQAYTDSIINSARTISVKYAQKKYANNPEKLEEVTNKYLFESKFDELPFPKIANSVRVNSLIIPIPHQLLDPDFIKDNIPFRSEKWILDVMFTREQLNTLIKKGTLEPIDEESMLIKKPKSLMNHYKPYFESSQLTFQFLNYNWLYILKPYNSIDSNCYLQINVIVGKNKTFTYYLHLNPTSKKLINFKKMRVNKTRLQEESGFIKDIMYELFQTNFLTDFKQSRSLNEEDIINKDESMELIRTIYEIYAQVIIESKIKYSRTKLMRLDLTTDIKTDQETINHALSIAEEVMSNVYENLATTNTTEKEELNFRSNFSVSKGKTSNAIYYANYFKGGRSNIAYAKTRRQIANKYQRNLMKRNIDSTAFKYARSFEEKDVLRVETQIKGFNNINDNYEFETHFIFVNWLKSIIHFLEKNKRLHLEYSRLRKEFVEGNLAPFEEFIKKEKRFTENHKNISKPP